MDTRYLAYVDADPDFYDDVWQVAPDPADVIQPADVPHDVAVTDSGPWRIYRGPDPLPRSGWKVHVSCRPDRADHVVATTTRVAFAHHLTCKHLRTRRLVTSTQAKYAEPTGAGKVLTVYPTSDRALEHVVRTLTTLLTGEPGARILSDIPVDGVPVSVRFGAFIAGFRLDPHGRTRVGVAAEGDGTCAPDDRAPHSAGRRTRDVPEFVAGLQATAATRDEAAVLPISDVRVLHRSNAGGVYAATWQDTTQVVLKEARRNSGFDTAGSDAVDRLHHERRALERLAGTGVVPELIDYRQAGDSEFLVMERVHGAPLTRGMATGHPGAVPGASSSAYRAWVEKVLTSTRRALDLLHAHGIAHLDIHPGNAIERDGRVVLLDLESCAIDEQTTAHGVCNILSAGENDVSPAADLRALSRMRSVLLNPQFSLTARRPDLADELDAAGKADVDPQTSPSPGSTRPDTDRIVSGLQVCANTTRDDRMFPSDIAGFGVPGGGYGLLHGAGGALAVLRECGRTVPDSWLDWLTSHLRSTAYLTPGLADGAEGDALCLAHLGQIETARHILSRWGGRVSPCPWWSRGTAGQAVAYAELGVILHDPTLTTTAIELTTETIETLSRDTSPPGHRPGLLDGWAGVGLALLRVAECLESAGHTCARIRHAAIRALDRELEHSHVVGGARLTLDGTRLMPYLGTGSAALGLLAKALIDTRPTRAEPAVVVDEVVRTLRLPSIASAGLLHGRAGLLVTLACLAPDEPAIDTHRERVRWHTVPVDSTTRRMHQDASTADFVLGDQSLRASADLATGAAGVLLAADGTPAAVPDKAARLLCLPRAAYSGTTVVTEVTPVTTSR